MRVDIVEQAQNIKAKTDKKIGDLAAAGMQQVQLLCKSAAQPPTADSGIFASATVPWESGVYYTQYALFSYNGVMGYVKQAHTAAAHYPPFSAGTEALYGARPSPDEDGIYPYAYNMAAESGMRVRDPDDGKVYECYQGIGDMIYKPHEIPAHFKEVQE